MFKHALIIFLIVGFVRCGLAEDHRSIEQPTVTRQNSGTQQNLIAVSPVNTSIVWVAGRGGTFLVTTNGGETWKSGVVPGAEALQFRDVQGVSDKIAFLLSIGSNATDFRIYKTRNGGESWSLEFENQNPDAFYDCFAFWNPRRGIAHSDSVNGQFPDLRTDDGRTWNDISSNLPPALPGEASFASSGTCVATQGERNAWIATGGSSTARILTTKDGGDSWKAFETPLLSSPTAGAFTVAFRDALHGIVGGGDLDTNDPNHAATAISEDGGETWTLTNQPPVTGAIYGLSYVAGTRSQREDRHLEEEGSRAVVVTANTGGAAWTPDEGTTWFPLSDVVGYWAVAFASRHIGWLVGTEGRILKISF
jgi:photosystem II stability/assembly factor-like uncharacterized protein